ncbi:MAG: hypothetical protein PHC41_10155 [Lachnospiraceae bacterium]|nr:hypothetical protein [Lachnospiraceae bacterium]MDD3616573.1 hypothetical protein [Lachnospiraceae bacterium]
MIKKNLLMSVLSFILAGQLILAPMSVYAAEEDAETADVAVVSEVPQNETDEASEELQATVATDKWPEEPELASGAAALYNVNSGQMLFTDDADDSMAPVGLTKYMTALLLVENCGMSDEITFDSNGTAYVTGGGTDLDTKNGENLTAEQCLYALLLGSYNDVATQVAVHISGSVENFVAMMNDKANQIGCTHTKFVNPTGVPDEEQKSSVRDMVLILEACYQNESLKNAAAVSTYTIPATNLTDSERTLTSNFALSEGGSNAYTGILGGKTTFSDAEGVALACAAERDGVEYLAVVMNGKDATAPTDAVTLLDYGYNNFALIDLTQGMEAVAGGVGIAPNTVTIDELEMVSAESNGNMKLMYYYGDYTIGMADVTIPSWNIFQNPEAARIAQEQAEAEAAEAQAAADEEASAKAREAAAQAKKAQYEKMQHTLYIALIGAVGVLIVTLLITLIYKLIQHIKWKKRNRRRRGRY